MYGTLNPSPRSPLYLRICTYIFMYTNSKKFHNTFIAQTWPDPFTSPRPKKRNTSPISPSLLLRVCLKQAPTCKVQNNFCQSERAPFICARPHSHAPCLIHLWHDSCTCATGMTHSYVPSTGARERTRHGERSRHIHFTEVSRLYFVLFDKWLTWSVLMYLTHVWCTQLYVWYTQLSTFADTYEIHDNCEYHIYIWEMHTPFVTYLTYVRYV